MYYTHMFPWEKFTLCTGDAIDTNERTTYKLVNLGDSTLNFSEDIISSLILESQIDFYIPLNDEYPCTHLISSGYNIFIWKREYINAILLVDGNIKPNQYLWLLNCISALLIDKNIIDKSNILNYRYSFLSFSTEYIDEPSDLSEFISTIPYTNYHSKFNTKQLGSEKIMTIIIDEDIRDAKDLIFEIERYSSYLDQKENSQNIKIIEKIISLSTSYHHNVIPDKREMILHKFQLFYLFSQVYIPRNSHSIIVDYGLSIIEESNALSMKNVTWSLNVLLKWYFGYEVEVEIYNWGVREVPNNLLLLPHLLNLQNVYPLKNQEALDAYLHINSSLNQSILMDGMDVLLNKIGELYLSLYNYVNSELFFNQTIILYGYLGKDELLERNKKRVVNCLLKHHEELSLAANLFNHSGRSNEATTLAWSSMTLSLRIVTTISNFGLHFTEPMNKILINFELCKVALLKEKTDMREVVELKLEELKNYFNSILTGELDEETIKLYNEMHSESLKFMVPQTPARFMFMTSDGRLLYTREASIEFDTDVDTSYLLAGALTAIRSVLQEASLSQTGSVKEIALGDSIMLIEARAAVVVVASVNTLNDKIRKLTENMANVIEDNWHDDLYDWFGDSESVQPMIDYVDDLIINELVYN